MTPALAVFNTLYLISTLTKSNILVYQTYTPTAAWSMPISKTPRVAFGNVGHIVLDNALHGVTPCNNNDKILRQPRNISTKDGSNWTLDYYLEFQERTANRCIKA